MFNPFFKNLIIYRLSRDVVIIRDGNTDELARQLEAFRFKPCGSQDMARSGWVSPLGQFSDQLFHLVNDQLLLVIRREEKILPNAVIAEELNKKVSKLEADQGRRLKKTEKDSLRDEVLHSLLPRAFTRSSAIRIWLNLSAALVMVDTSSARRAEDSLALLRKTLGSLPVVPLTMETPVELTLTEWVRRAGAPSGFVLGNEAELKAILEDGGIGRFKKQELSSDEILNHLDAGKVVTQLALNWQSRIDFTLNDSGVLKRLKFADELTQQNDDIDREDVAQRYDADFVLMTGELSNLTENLISALGGEAKR
ncbi:recombination-associated protein RdgC [Cronobacter sakazakii]|uniref:recombination-associated protein RdgC n=1 Tax=Cronobacter sakazakii TaxID=28141 RepID=UPI00289503B2|nr:recombination-associated protein RdgC [Cronobacter sakazakii]MDT3612149.1 recombination-associated protein RdgC [Cronobacter sakazakii]MDT3640887.1 recombination-associated protein RdgC [Cronobacter sakazakii]